MTDMQYILKTLSVSVHDKLKEKIYGKVFVKVGDEPFTLLYCKISNPITGTEWNCTIAKDLLVGAATSNNFAQELADEICKGYRRYVNNLYFIKS